MPKIIEPRGTCPACRFKVENIPLVLGGPQPRLSCPACGKALQAREFTAAGVKLELVADPPPPAKAANAGLLHFGGGEVTFF